MSYRDNAQPSDIVSGEFGSELIAMAGGVGQGADQECREAIVWPERLKLITIGGTTVEAASGPVLPEYPITIPISNTNKLFFAGTNGENVYITWRS